MQYKEGDKIEGIIYKGEDLVTSVKFGSVVKNEKHDSLQFDVSVGGRPSKLQVGDNCRLVTEEDETKVELAGMTTHGENFNQITFMMFTLLKD